MGESPEKWSISMSRSDMEIIDSIASKVGLSRSELVRQAVARFAKENKMSDGYVNQGAAETGAIEWIISRAQGLLGDFKMPVCTQLIVQHGLEGKLSESDLRTVLGRYRRHVDFWGTDDGVVQSEIEQFASLTKADPKKVWQIFYSFSPQKA
jgi:hypothetical protein